MGCRCGTSAEFPIAMAKSTCICGKKSAPRSFDTLRSGRDTGVADGTFIFGAICTVTKGEILAKDLGDSGFAFQEKPYWISPTDLTDKSHRDEYCLSS